MPSKRILITGAAGALGKELRRRLFGRYPLLRLSDVNAMEPARQGEEIVQCDLADAAAVDRVCEGIDAIVHLGGQSIEAPWERVIQSNLVGCVNLYEGARKARVDRVIFASSNHAIGFYHRRQRIDHTTPPKPDSRYGVSKAFGEDLSHYYALKHGIRGLCLRIGSCYPKPTNARFLSTWLSYDDFERLIEVGLHADYVYEIAYGVSDNTRAWWDNSRIKALGYRPQDNAEAFAKEVGHIVTDNAIDEAHQGGPFCSPDFSGRIEWLL
jgi:uronate dehydrogenase